MTMRNDDWKPMGCSKSSSKEEVYSNTILPQRTRKVLSIQPNHTPKETAKRRRRRTKKDKVSRRKKIIKTSAEINEKETKEAMKVKLAQSCLTLCDSLVYIVHGIVQARILEWLAFLVSRESSQPKDQAQVSCIAGGFSTSWAIREAQE